MFNNTEIKFNAAFAITSASYSPLSAEQQAEMEDRVQFFFRDYSWKHTDTDLNFTDKILPAHKCNKTDIDSMFKDVYLKPYLRDRLSSSYCLDNPEDLAFSGSVLEESKEGRMLMVTLAIKCEGDETIESLLPTNPAGLKCRDEDEVAKWLEDKTLSIIST